MRPDPLSPPIRGQKPLRAPEDVSKDFLDQKAWHAEPKAGFIAKRFHFLENMVPVSRATARVAPTNCIRARRFSLKLMTVLIKGALECV